MLGETLLSQPALGLGRSAPTLAGSYDDRAAAATAGESFEAFFLGHMLEYAFAGVSEDPLFGSPGEQVFRSLLIQEYGKVLARAGGVGIGEAVARELLSLQEAQ